MNAGLKTAAAKLRDILFGLIRDAQTDAPIRRIRRELKRGGWKL